jgi:photosystem II stability/assembly factor-like uncharacterized protein
MVKSLPLLFSATLMLGAAAAEPELLPLGPFGGDVRSIAVDPQRPDHLLLGTADGQIFTSSNWGETWERLTPGIGRRELVLDSLVFDPKDPQRIWVGGWELKSDRGGLYLSMDAGQTWQKQDLGIYESSIRAVAVSPQDPQTVAVGITEGVLLTRDGGRTWNRINRGYRSLHDVHSLAFDPQDPELLYVGTWRLAWRTPDLGRTWVPVHDGMFWDSDLFSLQIDPVDPQVIFAGACSGIYRSLNRGDKWLRLRNGLPGEAKRTRVVRIDLTDRRVIYAGTTEGLYRSEDHGDSWRVLVPDVVVNALVIDPRDSHRLILGTDDAGVLRSFDGGRSFEPANTGFTQRQISAVAGRPGSATEFFAAVALDAAYGGFFASRDRGRSWQTYNDGLGEAAALIRSILPSRQSSTVYLGTSRGVFRGVPFQKAWQKVPGTEKLTVNALEFGSPEEKHVLLACREGLFRLGSDGRVVRIKIPVYDREVFTIARESSRLYIGTEMGVFRSDNGGEQWMIKGNGMPYLTVTALAAAGDRVFAGTRSGVFWSDDNAEHWKPAHGVFPIEISAIQMGTNGDVYAADPLVGYLFASTDGGHSWNALHVGPSLSRISTLGLTDGGTLLAGTVSEGVFSIVPVGMAAGQTARESGR